MIRLVTCVLLVTSVLCTAAFAGEKMDAAFALAKLVNTKEVYQKAFMMTFNASLNQMEHAGKVTPNQVVEIRKEAKSFSSMIYEDPGFLKGIAATYEREFTEKELNTLLVFYKSDVGRKLLKKMPRLFQAGAGVGHRLAVKYRPMFMKKVTAIMAPKDVAKTKDTKAKSEK